MCLSRDALSKKGFRQILQKSIRQTKQHSKGVDDWLEIRILRVEITNGPTPEYLKIHYPPRNSSTDLQINGKYVRPSASAFQTLRRDSIDTKESAATYVNTDFTQIRGKLCFEICAADETLICSALDRKESSVFPTKWTLECSCALDRPSDWDPVTASDKSVKKFPSAEVSIVCRSRGGPLILTQKELLVTRRRRSRRENTLEAIPEGNDYENSFNEENVIDLDISTVAMLCDAVITKVGSLLRPRTAQAQGLCCRVVTWLGTGVLLGVGFGVGAFLGLGVGAGLLAIKTFHHSHPHSHHSP
eukprot:TRINITY_DN26533_c0_g1_i1.p1 TRINITY_DN26533_c0_g1~~TRINITY_DN26533_c0_g1_i1.p1  ORF type:complete len:302 (+),score=-14.08 TRINITY_DN26533_c0_g1_i1:120-1025(+)